MVNITMNNPSYDYAGNIVKQSCDNCNGLYDDSDGPYSKPFPRCSLKPHMENLKGFPFKTEQKCFQIHWGLLTDWDIESKKLKESIVKSQN